MERGHEESAPKHQSTACACRECAPGRFRGKKRAPAQPAHMCQRCFVGVCEALDTARPRTDGRWVAVQDEQGDLFKKPVEEQAE